MDETPAALFDAYEADFLLLIQGIRQKLESDHRGGQFSHRPLRKVLTTPCRTAQSVAAQG